MYTEQYNCRHRVLYRDLVVHTELYRELGMFTGSAYREQVVNRVLHKKQVAHSTRAAPQA